MLSANVFFQWKVDLTAYVEQHEFCFDAVLDEHVSNDEVLHFLICFCLEQAGECMLKMIII
jgi:hypothetical protein